MTRSCVTVCAVASLPLVAAVLTGCGSSSGTAPSGTSSADQSASPAAASSPSCDSQIKTWWSGGAQNQVSAVGNDATTLGAAFQSLGTDLQNGTDASSDEGTIQSTAANLQSEAQALEADRAPTCIPNMGADLDVAATHYETTAIDANNALNQLSSGNVSVAVSDMQAATQAADQASAKLTAATGAVSTYVAGNG